MYSKEEALEFLTDREKFLSLLEEIGKFASADDNLPELIDNFSTFQQLSNAREEMALLKSLEYVDLNFNSDEAQIFKSYLSLIHMPENEQAENKQAWLAFYSQIHENFGLEVTLQFYTMMINDKVEDEYTFQEILRKDLEQILQELANKTTLKSFCTYFVSKNHEHFDNLLSNDDLPEDLKKDVKKQGFSLDLRP